MALKTDEIINGAGNVISPTNRLLTGGHLWDKQRLYEVGTIATVSDNATIPTIRKYVCIAGGNINNNPTTEPSSWEPIDERSGIAWDVKNTYHRDDIIVKEVRLMPTMDPVFKFYFSKLDHNVGHDPETNTIYWEPDSIVRLLTKSVKLRIGSGGDYPTYTAALEALAQYSPKSGVTVELEAVTGYKMSERIVVIGQSFGWVKLTSVDPEVIMDREWLFKNPFQYKGLNSTSANLYSAMFGENAVMPVIDTFFAMDESGTINASIYGLQVFSSTATLTSNGGIVRCSGYGVVASRASTVNMNDATVNNCSLSNINAYRGSVINADGATLIQNSGGPVDPTTGDKGIYTIQASSGGRVNCNSGKFVTKLATTPHDINISMGGFVSISQPLNPDGTSNPSLCVSSLTSYITGHVPGTNEYYADYHGTWMKQL